jgi:hypothetical protein
MTMTTTQGKGMKRNPNDDDDPRKRMEGRRGGPGEHGATWSKGKETTQDGEDNNEDNHQGKGE